MARAQDANTPVLLLYNIDRTWEPEAMKMVLDQVDEVARALRERAHDVTRLPVCDGDLAGRLKAFDPAECVVFNWCEELPGTPYSDAVVAHTLDAMRFAYTGPTGDTLLLSWDKVKVKRLLGRHGLPTPRWRVCTDTAVHDWDCFPAIVKPAHEHCSYGITMDSVVLNPRQLRARVAYILEAFRQPALVEDFVDGREFHVSLWEDDGGLRVLPPAEMDFTAFADVRERLCTFADKFDLSSSHCEAIELRVPAPLSTGELRELERTARAAYRALGCRDYARLEIRLRDGVFYVLDVNPNPDISADTSTASAAEAVGISYGEWVSSLVGLAARRQRHALRC